MNYIFISMHHDLNAYIVHVYHLSYLHLYLYLSRFFSICLSCGSVYPCIHHASYVFIMYLICIFFHCSSCRSTLYMCVYVDIHIHGYRKRLERLVTDAEAMHLRCAFARPGFFCHGPFSAVEAEKPPGRRSSKWEIRTCKPETRTPKP